MTGYIKRINKINTIMKFPGYKDFSVYVVVDSGSSSIIINKKIWINDFGEQTPNSITFQAIVGVLGLMAF